MRRSAGTERLLAGCCACVLLLPGQSALFAAENSVPKRVKQEANRITTAALREELTYIASDELAGRDTPSPGLEKAAEYIEQRLERAGIEPAGDGGTYRQTIPLQQYRRDPSATAAQFAGRNLTLAQDYITPENPILAGSASGALVYVGSGFIVKAKGVNPYAGVDVKGKIVISTGRLPPGLKRSDLQGQPGRDYYFPPQAAKLNGAAGLIAILSKEQIRGFPALPDVPELSPRLSLRDGRNDVVDPWLPTLLPSEAVLREVFEGESADATRILSAFDGGKWPEPFALRPQKTLRFSNVLRRQDTRSVNILGKITGADPVLRREYVVLGAHYDHLGVGLPQGRRSGGTASEDSNDRIYNGADDDGSGTVRILELAKAIKRGKRFKRSVLIVWHSGEEKGMLGSRYLVAHPPVPIASMVAELQFDMIGRTRPPGDKDPLDEHLIPQGGIFVEGDGAISSDLAPRLRRVNEGYLSEGLSMTGDPATDPLRFFFRSDNARYALASVPTLQFHDGEHRDYHRPSDTLDKIDFPNMERILRTAYAFVASLANSPNRPSRDKPLTPEQKAVWVKMGLGS